MKYSIEVKKSVLKSLKKIDKSEQIKIVSVIKKLANNPRPKNSVKLSGSDYYRVRIGLYRVIYEIIDKVLVIIVLKVAHRKDAYR